MTTKRIVYRRSDGVVEIVNPSLLRMAELMAEGKTEDEAIAVIQVNALSHLSDRGFGPAEDVEIMEKDQISETQPGDRWFRNALEKPSMGSPAVNMSKAREIQASKIQNTRRSEVHRLQREEETALLAGRAADADQHAADRATLETMNLAAVANSIAGAANPTALKAVWPAGLPARGT